MAIDTREIKDSYYYTDIDPTLDSLNGIIGICDQFMKEGGDRLLYAMSMRNWEIDEIERLTTYIVQARQRMETELARLNRFKKDFNGEFATDHNDYFNSVSIVLKHSRSHTSPLKTILKKTCNRNHPNRYVCKRYKIKSKSVQKESPLAKGAYQPSLFNIEDPSVPAQVKALFHELQMFFQQEKEAMQICIDILKDEAQLRKDPVRSKSVLDAYKRKAYQKLKNKIILISEEAIETLKGINPAYQRYLGYASVEAFAQEELHKHNIACMDHFCLIGFADAKNKNHLDKDEIANWGDNPSLVKKIRYVISHFDELLPAYFKHKMIGKFEYYFCKWALPNNIKGAAEYLIKHYKGKWKLSLYGSVNTHGKEYDKNSDEVKNFTTAIISLLNSSNNPELAVQTA